MKISEIFYSIQGEVDVGIPAVFVRFSGCNLIKCGKACKFCDSLHAEKGVDMTVDEVLKEIDKYNCKNIIITGGESLTQKEELRELLDNLIMKKIIYIETNGTITDDVLWKFDFISCSPKKQSINYNTLKEIDNFNARFKFVYENSDDKWWEEVIKKVGIRPENVYIMPEGITRENQLKKMEEVIEYCKTKGYNFTPRLHVLVWNTKKGV